MFIMNVIAFSVLYGPTVILCVALGTSAFRYEAPEDCEWHYRTPGSDDVSLMCRLRTINSEFDSTNFSVIPSQHTASLRIECSKVLFFQSSLENQSFETLVDMRELEIEYCKIGEIPAMTFRGLTQLKNLTVRTHNTDWSAMTLSFQPNGLKSLTQLEKLDLGENNIVLFPDKLFCPLSSLKLLNLTYNRLQKITDLGFQLDDQSFALKPCKLGLLALDLSHNGIQMMPPMGLSSLPDLQLLYLQNNELTVLDDFALKGLGSLKVLNISSNKLVALPPELFQYSLSLQEIHIQNNSISVLAPTLFSNMGQLMVLDLSFNELTSNWVRGGIFSELIRLVVLNLSHNRLNRLDPSVFRNLYSLQILYLDHNEVESVSPNTFAAMYNLHTLVLSHNKVTVLDSMGLNGLFVLSILSLNGNNISEIQNEALHNCSNLQDLNLSGNRLTHVPAALQPLRFLKTLDLGNNQIKTIIDAPFRGMTQLYGLRLINNHIGNITRDCFDDMPSLKILNLAKNRIHAVEQGTFDSNVNLQALRLDGNLLVNIDGLFKKLPNLIWLNVSDNQIDWFDYDIIPYGLQWLDIHRNRIGSLGNYYERDGELKLQTLDASFNRITMIGGKTLPNSVELLFLNNNNISQVQPYTFLENINLTRVDLYANEIVKLDLNALRLTPRDVGRPLPEFYIGGNPFQCDCTMEWLQRINNLDHLRQHPQVMDLSSVYCQILFNRHQNFIPLVDADSSQFLCTYKAHCYALCHCCDFDACDCEMTCPTNCTCYHDQSWSANLVDCSGVGYEELPDRIPMDATEVYLDGNNITQLVSHSFIGRKNMQVLYLNNSNVELINSRAFNGIVNLRVLHLENNRLHILSGYEFDRLENLRELYLHNNQIYRIQNTTFSSLKSLEVLTLNGNAIVTFAFWGTSLPRLSHLTLADNPWSCECSFVQAFRTWLEKNRKKVIDAENVHCLQNTSVSVDLTNPGSNLTSCRELEAVTVVQPMVLHDYLPLLLATLGVFLVVLIMTLLFFLYRQEVRVWAHSKCGLRICHAGNYDSDTERLFDAFISYSSKDDMFVTQTLAPELEQGNPHYRLCLYYRDFPVSSYVADNIVEAVESSKRTILVLSKNFVQTEWCRFEFKSALHQVLKDRRKRLIVVVVGEVPQRDLDPDIRLCLKTNTCLYWGEKLFWAKLRYAMPDVKSNLSRTTCDRHYVPKLEYPPPHSNIQTLNSTMSSTNNSPYWTIRTINSPPSPAPIHPPPPLPHWDVPNRNSLRNQSRAADNSRYIPRTILPPPSQEYQVI